MAVSSKFFRTMVIAMIVTRVATFTLGLILNPDSSFTQKIINDPFHHYQLGLIVFFFSNIIRQMKFSPMISAVGMGIFLEELPVVFGDLGFDTTKFYHSAFEVDFLIIFTFVILIWKVIKYKGN